LKKKTGRQINPLTPELNRSAQRYLSRLFTGDLIFKGLTVRRLYKSFGVKGLTKCVISGFRREVDENVLF
jgi:hypothetical protein